MSALLAAGANVNAVNSRGATPLHGAVVLNREEVAAVLLAAGADPNTHCFLYGTFATTPLYNCIFFHDNARVAAALVAAGAKIDEAFISLASSAEMMTVLKQGLAWGALRSTWMRVVVAGCV